MPPPTDPPSAAHPSLAEIEGMIVDMDGVLWRDRAMLPGVAEFFEALNARQLPFVIATNNATSAASVICERLVSAGVSLSEAQVITSAQAAAAFLQQQVGAGTSVYVVGESGLRSAVIEAGMKIVDRAEAADVVVAGLERGLSWESLSEATLAIRAGALFVATNTDATFPSERGLLPGAGAVIAALQTASGVNPVVIGKPEPHLFLVAVDRLGTRRERTLVVGDRLETDILGARRAGLPSALVLTGVTRREDLPDVDVQPDWVFADLPALTAALETAR
ncbi:MAG: HAD-IIA family hydrolase [Anaerolineales bacterium]|nr:HAD-IIA family hydrolase [Anaerolineales bacterium]